MDIKALLRKLIAIRYVPGKPLGTYLYDVLFQAVIYAMVVFITILLVTLLAFGYVPIEGGGIANPPATIAYVWGHGILPVSLPIAGLSIMSNLIVTIKTKQPRMFIILGIWVLMLAIFNLLLSYVDLVAIVTPWVTF
jgi:hypothetical protein